MSCSKSGPVAKWACLPSVAITRIFDYLNRTERLNASTVNSHWRSNLYQKKFFTDFRFTLFVDQKLECEYFFKNLWNLTSDLTLKFDVINRYHLHQLQKILIKLCLSDIKSIRFEATVLPTYEPGEVTSSKKTFIYAPKDIERTILEPLRKFLGRRNVSLHVLDLGAIEMLVCYSQDFLNSIPILSELRELTLCTLRSNANDIPNINISIPHLTQCSFLQVLSLDYDVLTDNLVQCLQCVPLKKLLVLVHNEGVPDGRVSEEAWNCFASRFENCDLILTFIFSQSAVEMMMERMLRHTMPLTHVRAIFCGDINRTALNWISVTYYKTLKSIQWIDSTSTHSKALLPALYLGPDPFVMMAWRCSNLEEIVIHGYIVDPFNLIGIARLRGNRLKRLEVSLVDVNWGDFSEDYKSQISLQLNYDWSPVNVENLHPSLGYMPLSDSVKNDFIYQLMRTDLNS